MPRKFLPALSSMLMLIGCATQVASPSTAVSTDHSLPATAPVSSAVPTPTISPTVAPTPQPTTSAPAWQDTANMISPRAFHTATMLSDGRVLLAGGLINDRLDGKVLRAAELYDAERGSWTVTRPMTRARWGHTATPLPDGRVLVAGSYVAGGDPVASAETFDPGTGRWTATAHMHHGRGGHTATLLADGRVLVIGGGAEDTLLEGGPRSASAEVYDPRTGVWTAVRSMAQARKGFTATLLVDGRVLVAGGDADFSGAELYDPTTRRWVATGSMAAGRFGHTATLLTDGTVLVTGGCACSEPGALATAERYDPSTGRWIAAGKMAIARIFHTATLLTDGRVLVVNEGLAGDRRPSAELYEPGRNDWIATASPARTRFGYTATVLSNGSVLVAGDYDYGSQGSAELYDPGSGVPGS